MKLKIKIKFAVLMMMVMVIGTTTVTPALFMDKRVTASKVEVVYKSDSNKSKAKGYVTAKSKHYANVFLLCLGNELAKSGRKWGKGKVSVETKYVKRGYAGAAVDGAKIFYGFEE